MNYKTVRTAADLPFKGVELVRVDKTIKEVIVGGKLRISLGGYGTSLDVAVLTPLESAKRYRLTATIEGFAPTVQYFETEYEALTAGNPLEDKGAAIKVEPVDVLIDDAGVIQTAADAPEVESDIPF